MNVDTSKTEPTYFQECAARRLRAKGKWALSNSKQIDLLLSLILKTRSPALDEKLAFDIIPRKVMMEARKSIRAAKLTSEDLSRIVADSAPRAYRIDGSPQAARQLEKRKTQAKKARREGTEVVEKRKVSHDEVKRVNQLRTAIEMGVMWVNHFARLDWPVYVKIIEKLMHPVKGVEGFDVFYAGSKLTKFGSAGKENQCLWQAIADYQNIRSGDTDVDWKEVKEATIQFILQNPDRMTRVTGKSRQEKVKDVFLPSMIDDMKAGRPLPELVCLAIAELYGYTIGVYEARAARTRKHGYGDLYVPLVLHMDNTVPHFSLNKKKVHNEKRVVESQQEQQQASGSGPQNPVPPAPVVIQQPVLAVESVNVQPVAPALLEPIVQVEMRPEPQAAVPAVPLVAAVPVVAPEIVPAIVANPVVVTVAPVPAPVQPVAPITAVVSVETKYPRVYEYTWEAELHEPTHKLLWWSFAGAQSWGLAMYFMREFKGKTLSDSFLKLPQAAVVSAVMGVTLVPAYFASKWLSKFTRHAKVVIGKPEYKKVEQNKVSHNDDMHTPKVGRAVVRIVASHYLIPEKFVFWRTNKKDDFREEGDVNVDTLNASLSQTHNAGFLSSDTASGFIQRVFRTQDKYMTDDESLTQNDLTTRISLLVHRMRLEIHQRFLQSFL